jgi:hypothetical protein
MPVAETEDRPRAPHIRNRSRDFVSYAGVTMWNVREDQACRRAQVSCATLEQSLHIRNTHDDYGGTARATQTSWHLVRAAPRAGSVGRFLMPLTT